MFVNTITKEKYCSVSIKILRFFTSDFVLFMFSILSFFLLYNSLDMFGTFNHLFLLFNHLAWTVIFHPFSIICLLIIVQNIGLANNFTDIFWILNHVCCCVIKWWYLTTTLGMMLFYAFCYICRDLFCWLLFSGCIDTIFSHCVCLGLIIRFRLEPSLILLRFRIVFFISFVSWSVQTYR